MNGLRILLAAVLVTASFGCGDDDAEPTATPDTAAVDDTAGGDDLAGPTDTGGDDLAGPTDTGGEDEGGPPDTGDEDSEPPADPGEGDDTTPPTDTGSDTGQPDTAGPDGWLSKMELSNPEGLHELAPGYFGTVTIEFDLEPLALTDGVVGYAPLGTSLTGYSAFNMLFRLDPGGFFQVRDGADYAAEATVEYAAGEEYHVRIVSEIATDTYSVWVTPPGGGEVQLADGYAYRDDANNDIDHIGLVFLRSELGDDLYVVRNHTISGSGNCGEGPITEACICGGATQTSGSCCSGAWLDQDSCPVACGEGPITASCLCGGALQTGGACCGDAWLDQDSCPVACGEGPITASCLCGGAPQSSGSCCGGAWLDLASCPSACAEGAIGESCLCGGDVYDAGYCCGGVHQDVACGTAPVLAFPGAEGFGAMVTGGRGGQVIKVTTLQATGPGSLQEALSTPGPRIIVFDVSGVIDGDLVITEPDVTIAGQTAPGAGITIAGSLYTDYCDETVKNIIMRHVRVRHVCSTGDNTQCDAMQWSCASEFIVDHVSVSWGIDENFDLYSGANNFTIQDSVIENPCLGPPDSEFGGYHNYGVLNGPGGGSGSVLRTAFINSKARNPALADGPYEVINTFVYSFRLGLIHNNPASGSYNVIGNYYRKGPQFDTPGGSQPIAKPFYFDDEQPGGPVPTYYFDDNYLDDFEEPLGGFDDPFTAPHSNLGAGEILADPSQLAESAFDYSSGAFYQPPTIVPAADVPGVIWPQAGAWPRDVVSNATLADVTNFTGQFGCPNYDADLMSGLTPTAPPTDSDGDGMPDSWETDHGLNPADGSDHDTVLSSGYTAIEVYINERAEALVP